MQIASLLALVLKIAGLLRTYWPVVTAVVVLVSKIFTGDQSGATEALSMVIAAWASINSGSKTVKAVRSIAEGSAPAASPTACTRFDAAPRPTFSSPVLTPHPLSISYPYIPLAPDDRPDHPNVG